MSKHDAADAANDRHAERMADLPEQADPRDADPAIAVAWDEWLVPFCTCAACTTACRRVGR